MLVMPPCGSSPTYYNHMELPSWNKKSDLSEELSKYPLIKEEMSQKGKLDGRKISHFQMALKVKSMFTNPHMLSQDVSI